MTSNSTNLAVELNVPSLSEDRVSVMIVDDHQVVREGYRLLLEDNRINVITEAGSGREAVQHFTRYQPDVVILDLSMDDMDGLECLRRILLKDHTAKVLIFTMHDSINFAMRTLQSGAFGYVTKSHPSETLVEAVKALAQGQVYICQSIANQIAMADRQDLHNPFLRLSRQEFAVFRLVAEGLATDDIADRLSLTVKTVGNYKLQAMKKLQARSVADLVHIALKNGIIQSPITE